MTKEEFAEAMHRTGQLSVDAVVRSLKNPPGRRPGRKLVESSEWYRGLSDVDKEGLRRVMVRVAHKTVFSILVALDGADAITDEDGELRLSFVPKEGEEVVLAPTSAGLDLHDLLPKLEEL